LQWIRLLDDANVMDDVVRQKKLLELMAAEEAKDKSCPRYGSLLAECMIDPPL
jgi:hypothetical protein